jgi:hypothetical protein
MSAGRGCDGWHDSLLMELLAGEERSHAAALCRQALASSGSGGSWGLAWSARRGRRAVDGARSLGLDRRWAAAGHPEAIQAPDRYEIEIASGAARLEISAEEGSNRP